MAASLAFGVYDPDCPPLFGPVSTWERNLGAPISIISWYQAWGSHYAQCRPDLIHETHRHQMIPLITWEPWQLPETLPSKRTPADQPDFALARVLAGAYDSYIRSWARNLAQCQETIWLRPFHEMNGDWYPWGGMVNSNTPDVFRQVWRYVRSLFKAEGAHNVAWIWCPYARSVPDTEANSPEHYFPGCDQVDWLGLDGYNWGSTQSWSKWESFTEIFMPAYSRLVDLAPDKPMVIAEIGCAESGGDKADWIRDAFHQITSHFDKIQAVVWFQIDKECDWRLDSSPASLHAFQAQQRLFRSRKILGARWGAPEVRV
jgi:beta-mannanase